MHTSALAGSYSGTVEEREKESCVLPLAHNYIDRDWDCMCGGNAPLCREVTSNSEPMDSFSWVLPESEWEMDMRIGHCKGHAPCSPEVPLFKGVYKQAQTQS